MGAGPEKAAAGPSGASAARDGLTVFRVSGGVYWPGTRPPPPYRVKCSLALPDRGRVLLPGSSGFCRCRRRPIPPRRLSSAGVAGPAAGCAAGAPPRSRNACYAPGRPFPCPDPAGQAGGVGQCAVPDSFARHAGAGVADQSGLFAQPNGCRPAPGCAASRKGTAPSRGRRGMLGADRSRVRIPFGWVKRASAHSGRFRRREYDPGPGAVANPDSGPGFTGPSACAAGAPRPATECGGGQSRPAHRPRQRVVLGDDLEASLPELEKRCAGVRVGPAVERPVLFPGVKVHHGVFRFPGGHPAEVGGAGVTFFCAGNTARCSIAGSSAIGTAARPGADFHVATSGSGVLPLLPPAVRLHGGAREAKGGAVEGRDRSTPDTTIRQTRPLGVLRPCRAPASWSCTGCTWTRLRQVRPCHMMCRLWLR